MGNGYYHSKGIFWHTNMIFSDTFLIFLGDFIYICDGFLGLEDVFGVPIAIPFYHFLYFLLLIIVELFSKYYEAVIVT